MEVTSDLENNIFKSYPSPDVITLFPLEREESCCEKSCTNPHAKTTWTRPCGEKQGPQMMVIISCQTCKCHKSSDDSSPHS